MTNYDFLFSTLTENSLKIELVHHSICQRLNKVTKIFLLLFFFENQESEISNALATKKVSFYSVLNFSERCHLSINGQ